MDGYSLSDIASVAGNDGFGGTSAWVLIILFALIFGINGNGIGAGRTASDYGQFATSASQQEILFGQQFQGLNQAINKVGDGLSSLGYSQLQTMDANTATINDNVVSEGRALQNQLSECCCSTKEAIGQVRYDMATQNANTVSAIHAEGEATRAMIQQNKIESLQAQVNELKTQNMFCGIPRISNYAYGVYPYATNGCGCNSAI